MDLPTRASTLALLLVTVSASAAAQSGRLARPRMGWELSISTPALLVRDANGTKLYLDVAPVLGAVASWQLNPKLRSAVGLRLTSTPLEARQGGDRWEAGRANMAFVHLGLSAAVRERLEASASVGPAWLGGTRDVLPFESATSALYWAGTAGVSWRVSRSRPISATLSFEAFPLGATSAADPITERGWVHRFLIGVRRGA